VLGGEARQVDAVRDHDDLVETAALDRVHVPAHGLGVGRDAVRERVDHAAGPAVRPGRVGVQAALARQRDGHAREAGGKGPEQVPVVEVAVNDRGPPSTELPAQPRDGLGQLLPQKARAQSTVDDRHPELPHAVEQVVPLGAEAHEHRGERSAIEVGEDLEHVALGPGQAQPRHDVGDGNGSHAALGDGWRR
jgi:hypothetical protein